MTSATSTVQILGLWCELLETLSGIELDPGAEPQVIETRLAERQRIIEQLQTLDADLAKIAADRKAGFASLEVSQRPQAEALILKGRSTLAAIMEADRTTIENASAKRSELLATLRNVNLGKGYASLSHTPTYRPPVIVDKKA